MPGFFLSGQEVIAETARPCCSADRTPVYTNRFLSGLSCNQRALSSLRVCKLRPVSSP